MKERIVLQLIWPVKKDLQRFCLLELHPSCIISSFIRTTSGKEQRWQMIVIVLIRAIQLSAATATAKNTGSNSAFNGCNHFRTQQLSFQWLWPLQNTQQLRFQWLQPLQNTATQLSMVTNSTKANTAAQLLTFRHCKNTQQLIASIPSGHWAAFCGQYSQWTVRDWVTH